MALALFWQRGAHGSSGRGGIIIGASFRAQARIGNRWTRRVRRRRAASRPLSSIISVSSLSSRGHHLMDGGHRGIAARTSRRRLVHRNGHRGHRKHIVFSSSVSAWLARLGRQRRISQGSSQYRGSHLVVRHPHLFEIAVLLVGYCRWIMLGCAPRMRCCAHHRVFFAHGSVAARLIGGGRSRARTRLAHLSIAPRASLAAANGGGARGSRRVLRTYRLTSVGHLAGLSRKDAWWRNMVCSALKYRGISYNARRAS